MKYIRNNNYEAMQFDNEWAILNVDKHTVTTVNEVGNFLWEQLENAQTVDSLMQVVKENYEIEDQDVKEDVENFLNNMLQYELIVRK